MPEPLLVQLTAATSLNSLWIPEGTTFHLSVREVELSLFNATPSDSEGGDQVVRDGVRVPIKEFPKGLLLLEAERRLSPTKSEVELLRHFHDRHKTLDLELADGTLVPVEFVDSGFEPDPEHLAAIEFFDPVVEEMSAAARQVVGLIRWIFRVSSEGRPIVDDEWRWSLGDLRPLPVPRREPPWDDIGEEDLGLRARAQELFQKLLDAGAAEPVARFLLYEANSLRTVNPRAALLLAVTAAEVGIKDFIGTGSPERAWLIEEMPSPAIVKLVREYLPLLTDKRTTDGRALPKTMTSTLQRAVEARNMVTHRGAPPPTEDDLIEMLLTISDLLYTLDWLGGNEWAFSRLREETQSAWQPESP